MKIEHRKYIWKWYSYLKLTSDILNCFQETYTQDIIVKGGWNSCFKAILSHIMNTKAADDLVTQEAMASAAKSLT